MKAVIVDDKFSAREDLKDVLQDLFPEIELVAEAGNAADAILALEKRQPDLVFMDIDLNSDKSGFEVLEAVNIPEMYVIFVSDHSELAVRAFRINNTLDFLTKPIDEKHLKEAIGRVKKQLDLQGNAAGDAGKDSQGKAPRLLKPRLILSNQQGMLFPFIEDIIYIEADNGIVTFYLEGKVSKWIVTKPFGDYDFLHIEHPELFVKCGRSYILNRNKVMGFIRETRLIQMTNGREIPLPAKLTIKEVLGYEPD